MGPYHGGMTKKFRSIWMAATAAGTAILVIIISSCCVADGFDKYSVFKSVIGGKKTLPITDKFQDPCAMPEVIKQSTSDCRLDHLDVVSLGLSIDTMRQGDILTKMAQRNSEQRNAIYMGRMLEDDPKKYPSNGDDKNAAWKKRKADALELALQRFPEAWPIPTMTIVGSWNPKISRPRFTVEQTRNMADAMVNGLRQPAGLHWHQIVNLNEGRIFSDTPEGQIEEVFRRFEANPDMPALLVYVVSGRNMAVALSSENDPFGQGKLIGFDGPREPGELTDAMVAIIFARPERMDWLRPFAPYTKVNGAPLYPGFSGWKRKPKQEFHPTPFLPQPWTERGIEQWDQMKVLARIHRPVTVPLLDSDKPGRRLRSEEVSAALAKGWQQATMEIVPPPARVFFDGGDAHRPLAEIMPALQAVGSRLDLLDSNESYDLMARLGDTGAASPFVGIALATMATYTNADTSVVMPMRRDDQATIFTITSATPGKPPKGNVFGVNLLPQTASSDEPSATIVNKLKAEHRASAPEPPYTGPTSEQIEASRKELDKWFGDYPDDPEAG